MPTTSPTGDAKRPAAAYAYMARAFDDLNLWRRQRTEYPQSKVFAVGLDGVLTIWEVPVSALVELADKVQPHLLSHALRMHRPDEPLIEGPPTGDI